MSTSGRQKVLFGADFDPDAHRWLVVSGPLYLFVFKPSDRWSSVNPSKLVAFVEVPTATVPPDVRRKAGQRLGAHRRHHV